MKPAARMGDLSTIWGDFLNNYVDNGSVSVPQAPAGSSDLAHALQDLQNLQSDVQHYAPQLSSQWGWLAAQGNALASGQSASLTEDQWWSQFRSFLSALQGIEPASNAMTAINFGDQIADDAAQGFPEAGGVLVGEADAAGQTAAGALAPIGQGFSAAGDIAAFVAKYWPWMLLGTVAIFLLPHIIQELRE